MPKVRVYDAPAGCAMGLDEGVRTLHQQFDQAVVELQSAGQDIVRFNLGWDMREFAANPMIRKKLESAGVEILPLITVDEEIVIAGAYPNRATLNALFDRSVGEASGG